MKNTTSFFLALSNCFSKCHSVINATSAYPRLKTLALITLLLLGTSGVWGTDIDVTISTYATANSWGSSSSSGQKVIAINSDVSATVSSGTNTGKYYNDGWRIYESESATLTIETTSGTLNSITVTYTVANTGALFDGTTQVTSGSALSVSGTSKSLVVGNTGTKTNGQVKITKIEVSYTPSGGGTKYTVSFDVGASSSSQADIQEETVGGGITLPADPTPNCSEDWTFAGWKETSAVSSETTTAPTLLSAGDNFKPSGDVTLYAVYSRTESSGGGSSDVEFNFGYSNDWGQSSSWSGTDKSSVTATKDGVTVTHTRGNGSMYANTTATRFYKDNTLSFSVTTGSITSIVFTCSTYQTDISSDVGTCTATSSEFSWSGNVSSVSFTRPSNASSYAQFTKATITLGGGSTTYYWSSPTCAACTNEITITKGSNPANGTFTLSKTGAVCIDDTNASVTVTATPDSHYHLATVTSSGGGTVGTITDNTCTVSNISANTTINVTFAEDTKYAIRFYDNGTQIGTTQNLFNGETATPPTNPSGCEGYTFVGWWTAELADNNTTIQTWVTDFTVSGAQDYYAVYSHPDEESSNITLDPATDTSFPKDGITLSVTNGALDNGTDYRVYKNQTLTISSTVGIISTISFTFDGASNDGGGWASSYQPNAASWTSPTANGEQARITLLVVSVGSIYYTTTSECCATAPTLAFDVTEVTKFDGDEKFTYAATLSGSHPLNSTIVYSSNKPTKASVDASTGEVTIHDAMSDSPVIITATVAAASSGNTCQGKAKASYTLNIYNRVTWSVNGVAHTAGTPTTQTIEGGTITAYPTDPDGSSVCGGKVFKGWTTETYKNWDSDNAPSVLYTSLSSMSSIHIDENTTFYAVFAEEDNGGGASVELINEEFDNSTTNDSSSPIDSDAFTNFSGATYKAYTSQYGGVKLGSGSSNGYITTKSLDLSSVFTVSLDVRKYGTDGGNIYVQVANNDGTSQEIESDSFTSSEFTTFELSFAAATNDAAVEIGTTSNRAYIDNVVITTGSGASYSAYSTTCGPTIKADTVECLTSTKEQTVVSQTITVKGSSLEGSTLSASISGANASLFSCTLAANTITAGAISTTYTITYTPTAFGDARHTATLTFSDGTTTSNTITLRGRSLPERFAIVAYDGSYYYALDGSMSGSATLVEPLEVEIENGAVKKCPTRAIYTLEDMATPNRNVHLVGPAGALWGSSSGTDLNTKTTRDSAAAWVLTTRDFTTYRITNAKTSGRGLMYNNSAASKYFGHYKTTNYGTANYYGDLQLLPISAACACLNAPKPTVVARSTTATLTWEAIEGAARYVVTCTGGSVSVSGTTATISGLVASTSYDYTIKSVAADNDCSTTRRGSFTTTDCDNVPTNISAKTGTTTATITWKNAPTATIRFYAAAAAEDANEITSLAQVDKSSPCIVTGLSDNTTYYIKIFGGGSCVSSVYPLTTQTGAVEITAWDENGITITMNAEGAEASVLIEGKMETNKVVTTNYADSIFFSKYFEADGVNKMLAIYNGTKDTFNLSDYSLKRSHRTSNTEVKTYTFELSNLGVKKPGFICPTEEIILVNYAASNSAKDCLEEGEGEDWADMTSETTPASSSEVSGNTLMNFSGPMSIGLYSKKANKFIDVIGATTSADGTGDLVQINASNSQNCTYAKYNSTLNDNPGGFYVTDGVNYQTDTAGYFLSTNRCLLIRNNKVKSGLNAVQKNVYVADEEPYAMDCNADIVKAFKTLSSSEEEWRGFQIGSGTGESTHSLTCEGMAEVGTFDYQGYYTKFDTLKKVTELDGYDNGDGTYTIPIERLDTLACNMLRIKVFEGDEELVSKEYKVPIVISDNVTTDDEMFHNYGKKASDCKDCDVIIQGTGALTRKTSDEEDITEVRDVKIYPGGQLIIPSGKSLTVNSLSFRREDETISSADISGTLNIDGGDNNVFLDLRIDPSNWHYVALPYDCNIEEITFSNGDPAVQNVDFFVKWYDGYQRATQQIKSWKHVTNGIMKKGQGYIVGLSGNDNVKRELRFPMANTVIGQEGGNKSIGGGDFELKAFGNDDDGLAPNHKGWNLIGNPYLVGYYNPDFGDMLPVGALELDETVNPPIYKRTGNVKYIVAPVENGRKEYEQIALTGHTMLPFTAYFVQIGGDGMNASTAQTITFNTSHRSLVRRLTSEYEEDNHAVWCGITLANAEGEEDKTTLVISDDFTSGYDMMDDLVKMRGDRYSSYTKPVLASRNDEGEMAFNALPDNSAKAGVPLNYFAAAQGQYTLALDGRYSLEEIKEVQLYDSELDTWHDLKLEDYSFTSKRTDNKTRFTLYVTVERKQPQTPTSADNIYGNLTLTTSDKTLILSGLQDNAEIYVYDMSGKLIDSGSHSSSGESGVWRTTVPMQGVYFVRVMTDNEAQTLNTIVY